MHRVLSQSVLAIAILFGLHELQADEPPAAPSQDANKPKRATDADPVLKAAARRCRCVWIVMDLAALNIVNLTSQKEGAWMVAGIHEGGSSLYSQGAYIEAETGKVIDRGIRPVSVLKVWGKWK